MELTNFFGNPDAFKAEIAAMNEEKFKTFMARKEEQWNVLQRNHNAIKGKKVYAHIYMYKKNYRVVAV